MAINSAPLSDHIYDYERPTLRGKIDAVHTIANAHSAAEAADIHNGRYEGLKVEIPVSGLSIDQLERFVHGYFGHSKKLTGSLTDLGDGLLEFDIQVSGAEPVTVVGDARRFQR